MEQYCIYLEYRPATERSRALPSGWYGQVNPPVFVNEYIYCRTDNKEDAWSFSKYDAIETVMKMRRKGYDARCVPPITVTF